MGVTYYKLEQRYEGDVTKGCGLTSAQVDENFHFLRGYDIKDATFKDGILTLERVNCDKIVVEGIPEYVKAIAKGTMDEYDEPFDVSETTYDYNTGTLHLRVNGIDHPVPNFDKTLFDFHLHNGYGINGVGTASDPIRVSHIGDTGFYAPADSVIDLTNPDSTGLPSSSTVNRYVTKEKRTDYGVLYTYNGVRQIKDYLERIGSTWRIPTLDDWNSMLNAIECDNGEPNHGRSTEQVLNGQIAAFRLKSPDKDYGFNDDSEINDFSALPTHRTFVDGEEKRTTSFWTSTIDEENNFMYAKGLIQDNPYVINLQGGEFLDYRAIRLVKDFDDNGSEDIDGRTYGTTQMRGIDGALVWTTENVYFGNDVVSSAYTKEPYGNGFFFDTEEKYRNTEKVIYCINYKDSFTGAWEKRELKVNDIIMLGKFSPDNDPDAIETNVEVIVREDGHGNQILVSRESELFGKVYENVEEYLLDLSAVTRDQIEALSERVGDLEAISADTRLAELEAISADTRLEGLEGFAESVDSRITALEEISSGATNDIEELKKKVGDGFLDESANTVSLTDKITGLTKDLADEVEARTKNDINYDSKIVNLGPEGHGLEIRSEGEPIVVNDTPMPNVLKRSFSLNMGSINIKEMN